MPRAKNIDLDKKAANIASQMKDLQRQMDSIEATRRQQAEARRLVVQKEIAGHETAIQTLRAELSKLGTASATSVTTTASSVVAPPVKVRKKPGPKPGAKKAAAAAAAVTAATPVKVRKKPGPKPGSKRKAAAKIVAKTKVAKAVKAKPAAKAVAKTRNKPGPKPGSKRTPKASAKATKAPKKGAKAAKPAAAISAVAEGRRAVARGDRPPMKEAIAKVMGAKTCDAATVMDGLKAKNWMPNAADPRQYISFILSSNKDIFEKVSHGHYKVKEGVTFVHTTKAPKAKSATPKTTAAPKTEATAAEVDSTVRRLTTDADGNVAPNPFA